MNKKLGKSDKYGTKYLSAGIHLLPYNLSGHQVCAQATFGCSSTCLNLSGMGFFNSVQRSRKEKTLFLFKETEKFMDQLYKELHSFVKSCLFQRKKPAVRLNLTSDLDWRRFRKTIFDDFPKVQFYDYTKITSRARDWVNGKLPANYHLTFSRSEKNDADAKSLLSAGMNVAVVFRKDVPKKFWDTKVVSGDEHDLRFLEKSPCIIGLKAKGLARKDISGFVLDLN